MKPLSDDSSIIYVRVARRDKELLRTLSDRDFGGSMAACIRHMIQVYAKGQTGRVTGRHLDED